MYAFGVHEQLWLRKTKLITIVHLPNGRFSFKKRRRARTDDDDKRKRQIKTSNSGVCQRRSRARLRDCAVNRDSGAHFSVSLGEHVHRSAATVRASA